MPRKKHILSNQFPYHLTARSNNREWFGLSPEACWEIYSNYLFFIHRAYGVKIHAFTLMTNHFHLIMTTPKFFLPEVMNRFMTETSRAINDDSGRMNHVYGGRHKACLIDNPQYFANAIKYVYRNPIHASLCNRVEEYPWSSLAGAMGQTKIIYPLERHIFTSVLPTPFDKELSWLNTDLTDSHKKLIARALTKTTFNIPCKRTSDDGYELKTSLC